MVFTQLGIILLIILQLQRLEKEEESMTYLEISPGFSFPTQIGGTCT